MAEQRDGTKRPDDAAVAAQEPAPPIRYGPLADWIGFHLRLAQASSFQAFARRVQAVDLRPGRFAVLMLIRQNPGISQTDLSRANGRDKSSLTPVLTDLVRRKLVNRQRTAHDRRTYRLTLTPAGEAMLAELPECAKSHEAALDQVIGPRDRAKFLQILRRVAFDLV